MNQAELSCIENLLNCYCREIAAPEGQVRFTLHELAPRVVLTLPATGKEIEAPARPRSLTGALELLGPCRNLDWRGVASLLIAEVEARERSHAHPELLGLIEDSLAVTKVILQQGARTDCGELNFLTSEQSLTYGHPFHPSPKSRAGFSEEELLKYSPELGAHFSLHYFAVREAFIEQDSIAGVSCTELVRRQAPGVETPAPGFALVPLHPWQANYVLSYPMVCRALERGDLVHLGQQGPEYHATSSVRTLYAPGLPYFMKTALNMRITNCLRRNSPHELASSLEISRWMRELKTDLATRFPKFIALDEPAYLSLRLPATNDAEREQSDRIAESFGLMLRQTGPLESDPTLKPIVAAALFGNRNRGREQLNAILALDDRKQWFARYLELTLPPLLKLFFDHGLMFEPHLQNLLLGLRAGAVERIFLRDFDNGKVISEWFPAARLAALDLVVRDELIYQAGPAWKRFTYCLVVNNLAEAAAMVAGGDFALERQLWRLIHDAFENAVGTLANPLAHQFIGELLASRILPAKGNFITRVFKRPDRKAGYFPVANPMSVLERQAAIS